MGLFDKLVPELIPPFDPYNHGDHIHGDVRAKLTFYEDAFEKLIADGTRNSLDLPAYYQYNPERWRIFLNGARVEPDDVPNQFSDPQDRFILEPDAGNTLDIHSAERPRYIVGYESVATTAGKGAAPLGDGDRYRVGVRDFDPDGENMAYFEVTNDGNRLVIESGGSEVVSEPFEFPEGAGYQTPIRYEIQFNWYNVGRYLFRVTYTDGSRPEGRRQVNEVVGELTVDDDFVTNDGVYHVFHEIDATTAGQRFEAGSMGYNVLGDVEETSRTKAARNINLLYGGTGDYEPLLALRVDPERGNVYCQLQDVSVFPDGGSGELVVIVVSADQTDATGFATPVEHSPSNSVVEITENVTTFPDQDGNIVTSAADPNGYQVGFDKWDETGVGTNNRAAGSTQVQNKRPLYEDDVAIFLYRADTATERSVNTTYFVEQDW